ncbi:Crp/Fnr family transcriptional regulator [Bacillus chungangensis]|uniref:CRP/FNR family transcriptional regulator n=1 Tax=Bacillus chungangensis TaxID=587633 RepID=A0ABT9WNL9_9BACI|nr:Crp/Fnr family transcriptional regulator [Bacillus chungangensis]MDQ0174877.1 CRP/FNR family transcriptional regulator [Bacillus chungangensis]
MSSSKKMCVSLVPIFNHLEEEEMKKIVELSNSKKYKKGEIIFRSGESENHLYIVHKGKVKIFRLTESGKEQFIRTMESGDFLGELSLFTKNKHNSFAEAMTDVEICVIERNDFQKLLYQFPAISLKVLEELSSRLESAEKLVSQLSSQDAEIRVASYLMELVDIHGKTEIMLPMSKKDLASYLGTTQETLSRKLSGFQQKGYIKQSGQRKIHIIDMAAIRQIIGSRDLRCKNSSR